jgi:hypothetical protein
VLGGILGYRQQKAQKEARKEQAMLNMYSPIFGQAPVALGAKQEMTMPGVFAGGIGGYDLGAQLDKNARDERKTAAETERELIINQALRDRLGSGASTDVFIPYAAPPSQSVGNPARGPYDYRGGYNPFAP